MVEKLVSSHRETQEITLANKSLMLANIASSNLVLDGEQMTT